MNISNAVEWCQVCDSVSSQNKCKRKIDVKMTVLDESAQMKLYISVPHKIIVPGCSILVFAMSQKWTLL